MAACTAPEGYYRIDPSKNAGKGGLTMKRSLSDGGPLRFYACGKCIDCRLSESQEKALRCMHEVQTSAGPGSFVTLTYNDENLPDDWCLEYRDFQLFMHRLRKAIPGAGRFAMSGEYGDDNDRPHYHAILFNCHFDDRVFFKRINGIDYYISTLLSRLWGKGFCLIGDVTFASAAYVARYNLKKITGPDSGSAYQFVVPNTGEVVDRPPPFWRTSNRPGLGAEWFMRFGADCFPSDYLVWKGKKLPVPRYYYKLLERSDPLLFERVRLHRQEILQIGQRVSLDIVHGFAYVTDDVERSSRRLRDKNELARLNSNQKRELK